MWMTKTSDADVEFSFVNDCKKCQLINQIHLFSKPSLINSRLPILQQRKEKEDEFEKAIQLS